MSVGSLIRTNGPGVGAAPAAPGVGLRRIWMTSFNSRVVPLPSTWRIRRMLNSAGVAVVTLGCALCASLTEFRVTDPIHNPVLGLGWLAAGFCDATTTFWTTPWLEKVRTVLELAG